jgi:acetolactate synthase I/II/III large subunit
MNSSFTVADRITAHLAATGIERVFVYPGGTIAPLINGFVSAGVHIEVFKHEQGATYAALAVARLTGRPQVVMVTSGPGVTNALTPLADAYYDSTPLLLITGQIGTGDLNSGRKVRQRGFQEVPVVDLVRPITKAAACPASADAALACVDQLLTAACSGRPGPVVLDFPMDIQRAVCAVDAPLPTATPMPVCPPPRTNDIEAIATALATARRPVLLLGQGALQAGSFASYRDLAERADALVVSSLPGLGAYAGDDPRFLGYIGHTGHAAANRAVHGADLLLVLGARLDIRQTGSVTDSFVPAGRVAWVNNDADELAHPRVTVTWALHADVADAVDALCRALPARSSEIDLTWQQARQSERRAGEEDPPPAQGLGPRTVLAAMAARMANRRGVVTTGVGSHQQWAARHLCYAPEGWYLLTSAGHGAMGYDLPSAIGAALARPGQPVVCVVGDGSLLMNIQELASLAERRLPVKILLLNNRRLGIVSQFQRITWGEDPTSGDFGTPDFIAVARGFGIAATRASTADELAAGLNALWLDEQPALLEVIIDHGADVVPMLLGGQTMDTMWWGLER